MYIKPGLLVCIQPRVLLKVKRYDPQELKKRNEVYPVSRI